MVLGYLSWSMLVRTLITGASKVVLDRSRRRLVGRLGESEPRTDELPLAWAIINFPTQ